MSHISDREHLLNSIEYRGDITVIYKSYNLNSLYNIKPKYEHNNLALQLTNLTNNSYAITIINLAMDIPDKDISENIFLNLENEDNVDFRKGYSKDYFVKVLHNIDHLSLALIIDTKNRYYEQSISEITNKEILGNHTPDLICNTNYINKNHPMYTIIDVTTGYDINMEHERKYDKYRRYIDNNFFISYSTIKIKDYNFLYQDAKEAFTTAKNIIKSLLDKCSVDIKNNTDYLAGQKYYNKYYIGSVCPVYPYKHIMNTYIENMLGINNIYDNPINSEEIDNKVVQYITKNIITLTDKLSTPKTENTYEIFKSKMDEFSILDDDCEYDNRKIFNFPPTTNHMLDVGRDLRYYYSGDNYKTWQQLRAADILLLRKDIIFEFTDNKWEFVYKHLDPDTDLAYQLKRKSEEVLRELTTLKSQTPKTSRKEDTQLLKRLYSLYLTSDALHSQLSIDYNLAMEVYHSWKLQYTDTLNNPVDAVLSVIHKTRVSLRDRITTGSYVIKDKELYDQINLQDMLVPNNIKFITEAEIKMEKLALKDYIKDRNKNRHITHSSAQYLITTDLEIKGYKNTDFFKTYFGTGIKEQRAEKTVAGHKEKKRVVLFNDEAIEASSNIINYLSLKDNTNYPIFTSGERESFEYKVCKSELDPLYDTIMGTKAFKMMHTNSNVGTSIAMGIHKVKKSNRFRIFTDQSGNVTTFAVGSATNIKSYMNIVVTDENIPREMWIYFNICAKGKVPNRDYYMYLTKPYTLVSESMNRMVDTDTVLLPTFIDNYFKLKSKHNELSKQDFDKLFIEKVISPRVMIYCEGSMTTARICEKARNLVPNIISEYSNAKMFVSEYIKDRPTTVVGVYILNLMLQWCKSMDTEGLRKNLVKAKEIKIPSLWFPGLYISDIEDISEEMFYVFFCSRRTYTNYTAFKSHFETLLKFKYARLKRLEDNPNICKLGGDIHNKADYVMNTYKDFYHIVPEVLYRSAEVGLTKISLEHGERINRFRTTIYDEPLINLANTKAREADEYKPELNYKEELLSVYEKGLIDEFKTLRDAMNKDRGFRDGGKALDKTIAFNLEKGILTYSEAMEYFIDRKFHFGIRNKDEERGKMREFGAPNLVDTSYLKPVELFADKILKFTKQEYITNGGMKPEMFKEMCDSLYKEYATSEYNKEGKYRVAYTSIDYTKWSVNMFLEVFMWLALAVFHQQLCSEDEFYWMMHTFKGLNEKLILVNPSIFETLSVTDFQKKLLEECDTDYLGIQIAGNWIQGKLNKWSSLLHYCKCEYTRHITQLLIGDKKFKVEFACHSDDGATIVLYMYKSRDERFEYIFNKYDKDWIYKLYRVIEKFIALCLNMQESEKKTCESKFYCEFISICYFKGSIGMPTYKGTGTMSTRLPNDTYDKVCYAMIAPMIDARTKGSSIISIKCMQDCHKRILQKIYGFSAKYFNDKIGVPVHLGGYLQGDIVVMMLGGPDAHLLYCKDEYLSILLSKSNSEYEKTSESRLYFPTNIMYRPSQKWKKVNNKLQVLGYNTVLGKQYLDIFKRFGDELFYLRNVTLSDPLYALAQAVSGFNNINIKKAYDRDDSLYRLFKIRIKMHSPDYVDQNKDKNKRITIEEYFDTIEPHKDVDKEKITNMLEMYVAPIAHYLKSWLETVAVKSIDDIKIQYQFDQIPLKRGLTVLSSRLDGSLLYRYLIDPLSTEVPARDKQSIPYESLKLRTVMSLLDMDMSMVNMIPNLLTAPKGSLYMYMPNDPQAWEESNNRFGYLYQTTLIPYKRIHFISQTVYRSELMIPLLMNDTVSKLTDNHIATILNMYLYALKKGYSENEIRHLFAQSTLKVDNQIHTIESLIKSKALWSIITGYQTEIFAELAVISKYLYDIIPSNILFNEEFSNRSKRYLDNDGTLHIICHKIKASCNISCIPINKDMEPERYPSDYSKYRFEAHIIGRHLRDAVDILNYICKNIIKVDPKVFREKNKTRIGNGINVIDGKFREIVGNAILSNIMFTERSTAMKDTCSATPTTLILNGLAITAIQPKQLYIAEGFNTNDQVLNTLIRTETLYPSISNTSSSVEWMTESNIVKIVGVYNDDLLNTEMKKKILKTINSLRLGTYDLGNYTIETPSKSTQTGNQFSFDDEFGDIDNMDFSIMDDDTLDTGLMSGNIIEDVESELIFNLVNYTYKNGKYLFEYNKDVSLVPLDNLINKTIHELKRLNMNDIEIQLLQNIFQVRGLNVSGIYATVEFKNVKSELNKDFSKQYKDVLVKRVINGYMSPLLECTLLFMDNKIVKEENAAEFNKLLIIWACLCEQYDPDTLKLFMLSQNHSLPVFLKGFDIKVTLVRTHKDDYTEL